MIPFDFQDGAVSALYKYFSLSSGNPIVAMPTGTGKSVVIAMFIRSVFDSYAGQRVMVLTHVKELIEQNLEKLLSFWPTAPAGVFSSGIGRKESTFPITFGGVASVNKADLSKFGQINLLLIDECHLLSPKDTTMYQRIITRLKEINPLLKVIGFTATAYRSGIGKLTQGGIFTDVCYDLTSLVEFNRLVDMGYIIPLIPKRTETSYDVSGVKITAGDYNQHDLELVVDRQDLTQRVISEMMYYGANRKHWLVFAAGINHALHVTETMQAMGIPACVIHSKLGKEERDQNISDFKQGKYLAAVNNNVLTTGFDFPGIDMIAVLRPTSSTSLWVQMLGRGTRPVWPQGANLQTVENRLSLIATSEKQNCLVLDFAKNTERLGPINDPVLPKKKIKSDTPGVAPIRICEFCGVYNHASATFCFSCKAVFPRGVNINDSAGTKEVMISSLPQFEHFPVDKVTYSNHAKTGRPERTLQVSYFCGMRMFREWVCFEHKGLPKHKAHKWWRERCAEPYPDTIAEAMLLVNGLKVPTEIKIWINKPYPEIMGYTFGEINYDDSIRI